MCHLLCSFSISNMHPTTHNPGTQGLSRSRTCSNLLVVALAGMCMGSLPPIFTQLTLLQIMYVYIYSYSSMYHSNTAVVYTDIVVVKELNREHELT